MFNLNGHYIHYTCPSRASVGICHTHIRIKYRQIADYVPQAPRMYTTSHNSTAQIDGRVKRRCLFVGGLALQSGNVVLFACCLLSTWIYIYMSCGCVLVKGEDAEKPRILSYTVPPDKNNKRPHRAPEFTDLAEASTNVFGRASRVGVLSVLPKSDHNKKRVGKSTKTSHKHTDTYMIYSTIIRRYHKVPDQGNVDVADWSRRRPAREFESHRRRYPFVFFSIFFISEDSIRGDTSLLAYYLLLLLTL